MPGRHARDPSVAGVDGAASGRQRALALVAPSADGGHQRSRLASRSRACAVRHATTGRVTLSRHPDESIGSASTSAWVWSRASATGHRTGSIMGIHLRSDTASWQPRLLIAACAGTSRCARRRRRTTRAPIPTPSAGGRRPRLPRHRPRPSLASPTATPQPRRREPSHRRSQRPGDLDPDRRPSSMRAAGTGPRRPGDRPPDPSTSPRSRAQPTLVFFGYTHCPDVCPATIGELVELVDRRPDVHVVFVTVDPERDTPEFMGEWTEYPARSSFVGVTGSPTAIRHAADGYGVRYARVDSASAAGYSMSHTAFVYLIDAEGRLRLHFPFGTGWESMLQTLDTIAPTDAGGRPREPFRIRPIRAIVIDQPHGRAGRRRPSRAPRGPIADQPRPRRSQRHPWRRT